MAPIGPAPAAPPPRWSVPFDHHRDDPFVDLARPASEQLGKDLRRGLEHWRDYAGCSQGKHRRGRCHHHRHPELLKRYRGQGRGRRGKGTDHLVELAWKRSESAEHHGRFAQWLILHMDRLTRYVGFLDARGELEPYELEDIAHDLRRPGEERIPIDVLEDVINAFLAARLIYRWQGRDRICTECRTELAEKGTRCPKCGSDSFRYRGKTGILRVTHEFLIASGMAQLRDQRLQADERRARAAERRQAPDELRAVVFTAAQQLTFDKRSEHVRRQVMAEHPDWVQAGQRFRLEAEIDSRLQELERRSREAHEGRPPDDRP